MEQGCCRLVPMLLSFRRRVCTIHKNRCLLGESALLYCRVGSECMVSGRFWCLV